MSALLDKLELMVQNPLYVNLQLTGLLSRLACYPQPLLKSLLLSNSLVFQPSVKSLLQVCDLLNISWMHNICIFVYCVWQFKELDKTSQI